MGVRAEGRRMVGGEDGEVGRSGGFGNGKRVRMVKKRQIVDDGDE